MTTKKPINRSKTWNPPGTKIILELIYVVLGVFKVRKNLKVTPSSYETFDTKINRSGDWNISYQPFSFFKPEFDDSLSLSSQQKKTKNKKIKLGTKMYCLQIQGTSNLITKKYERLKWMFQQNLQPPCYQRFSL
jgi:hypothetical protein